MDHAILIIMIMYVCIATGAFCATFWLDFTTRFDTSKLEEISNYLNTFIPFILGLYVSIALSRWWAMRTEGIGKVLDATQDVALISTALLPGAEHQPFHDQNLRYALASVSLIVNMFRPMDDKKLEVLGPVRDNLLTAEEVEVLRGTPYRTRPSVMWTWILAVSTKVFEDHGVPPGKQRDVTTEVIKAREAIECILTYMFSQLPFAYVHLVTLLVNLNNLVMSVKCGVIGAAQIREKNWMYAGSQVVFLLAVPLLYQGLLSLTYVIGDPFGEDLLDFPVMAYQEYANESAVSISNYVIQCPALKLQFGAPPTEERLALLRGAGRPNPNAVQAAPASISTNDAISREARTLALQKEEEQKLLAKMQSQDELIDSLRKQNRFAASHVEEMKNKVQVLEGRMA